jgi:hypothetical protein
MSHPNRHALAALLLGFFLLPAASFAEDGRAPGFKPGPAIPAPVGNKPVDATSGPRRDASPAPQAVVTADDIIVQGSACVGLDCVSNESFGFDTLRLKENNTRIKFDDTSASAGFPANDWQLTANDSASGGLNKFAIEDITGAKVPFTTVAGAPSNSLFIQSTGRIGFRTDNPLLDLHMVTGDTPAIRFEQTNLSGYTAQTWDVAGNEANFFVRDLTGGSRLPFRIRPGAPTSSIDIAATGFVGIGTASPDVVLDLNAPTASTAPVAVFRVGDGSSDPSLANRFTVDSFGNVTARGTISQLSSRSAKENFSPANGAMLLSKLEKLPILNWNYIGAPSDDRHVGPVAEDFHAAFGLGRDDHVVAPTDMAGVALASVQALQEEVKLRDTRIAELEKRMGELEALVRKAAQ